jgi:signal transduction histidine kinase
LKLSNLHFILFLVSCICIGCSKKLDKTKDQELTDVSISKLLDIADDWERQNIDSAYYYSQKAYQKSLKNNDASNTIKSLNNIGYALLEMNKPQEAYLKHQEALELSKKQKDTIQIAKTLNFIGRYFNNFSDYDTSLNYFIQSHKLRIDLKDTIGISVTATNIGMNYFKLKQYNLAETYLLKSIEIDSILKDSLYLSTDYINIGLVYKDSKRYKKALSVNQKALNISKKINDKEGVSLALGNIGMTYLALNNFDKAQSFIDKSMILRRKMNRPFYKLWGHIFYMDLYHNWNKHELSILHSDSALNINVKINNKRLLERIYKSRASSFEQLGNHQIALKSKKLQELVKDSLYNELKVKNISSSQVQLGLLEKENELIKKESEVMVLNERNKKKNQLFIFGSILALGLFSIVYLWHSKKHETKKAELKRQFAQDLIKSVEKERKRISSELHDSIGQSLLLIKNKILLKKESNTSLIDDAIKEVRHISQALHPFQFEKLGLIQSIKNLTIRLQNNSEIFYSDNINDFELNIQKDKQIFLFRMLQESLNNVEKHSKAKACKISVLDREKTVLFEIKDNGIGFDVTKNNSQLNGLGMQTLKERAQIIEAQLIISSIKGEGTTIQINVPKS